MKILDRLVRLLFDGFPVPKPAVKQEPAPPELPPRMREKSGQWRQVESGKWEVDEQITREPAIYDYWTIYRDDPHMLQHTIIRLADDGWFPLETYERHALLSRPKR